MIIICPNERKEEILKKNEAVHNYKFFTLKDIKEKIFFRYHDLALYEIVVKYQIKPSIANKILDNLYYVDKEYNDKKLKKLFEIKTYLDNKNYLIRSNFLRMLNDSIEIIDYPDNKELKYIVEILNKYADVSIKSPEKRYNLKNIYEFNNVEEEVRFVAENILELLSQGVNINNIFVINNTKEYNSAINRIFNLFNIPYDINNPKKITMFPITKEFLSFIKTTEMKVKELNDYLYQLNLKYQDESIINEIINVLNKYYELDINAKDLYEVIKYQLSKIKIAEKYKNVVKFTSINQTFTDSDYVFSISNNEGITITNYKDDDYLSNQEKSLIGIDLNIDLVESETSFILCKLGNIKNLTLSYKLNSNSSKYSIANIFENLEINHYIFKNNALKYNNYLYKKLEKFDNNYQKIDFNDLKEFVKNKLNLSYSSMDQFFKCQFRFYLNNILKIEPYEETMAIKVGNMFHKILEKVLKNKYQNQEEIVEKEVQSYLNKDAKEKFYGQKLKKEIYKLIEIIKRREEVSDFKNAYFEQVLTIEKNAKINIKVLGFVDKILVFEDEKSNYVVVIDYKTGTVSTDLTKVKDGFNMQLLMYLYLIKNTKLIKNPFLVGAYIEHILEDLKPYEEGKNYAEIEKSLYRLEGISTSDKNVLSHFDHNYDIASFIKGIKVKNDGEFYNYSKVNSEKEFNRLLELVDQNINKVIKSIEECDFKINPKRYITDHPNDIIGCIYCPFKEVCYCTADNIEVLEETTMESIMEGVNEVD